MIITYRRPDREPVDLAIDDTHCDRLLDWLATNFSRPDADADKRYWLMLAGRDAAVLAVAGAVAATVEKKRKARRG